MGYEQSVREKHKFEKAVRDFFKYASVMTDEEIELCTGRIADRITSSDSESIKMNINQIIKYGRKHFQIGLKGYLVPSQINLRDLSYLLLRNLMMLRNS